MGVWVGVFVEEGLGVKVGKGVDEGDGAKVDVGDEVWLEVAGRFVGSAAVQAVSHKSVKQKTKNECFISSPP